MLQHFPRLPNLVPSRGTAATRLLCQKLFLAQGWTFEGEFPNLPKAVAVVSPHTSNIDGWYGFLVIGALGLKVNVFGKDSLFRFPFKSLLKWIGIIPVKRNSTNGLTEQAVEKIHSTDKIWIALAPEGTRKRAEKIKSGFYWIAYQANIPIVMFSFDYKHKKVYCLGTMQPTGNYEADLEYILKQYQGKFFPKKPEWLALPLQKLLENAGKN